MIERKYSQIRDYISFDPVVCPELSMTILIFCKTF